jgi:YegS/Rv2252/BmrU family lipid kinase
MTMHSSRQIVIIHNPTAGRRRKKKLHGVVQHLQKMGCSVVQLATAAAGDAEVMARQIRAQQCDVLVAAGGDGTINEVVNGLLQNPDRDHLQMGVIPMGTANVAALELGLGKKIRQIAHTLAYGVPHPVHPAQANGRAFVMMAGIGIDAQVVDQVKLGLKRKIGALAYVWETLNQARNYRYAPCEVILDGVSHTAVAAVICNGSRYGGPFVAAKGADLSLPEVHVCLLKRPGILNVLRYAVWLGMGRLDRLPDVDVVAASRVQVSGPDNAPVQADGDVIARLPLDITPVATPLSFLIPAARA